MDSISLQGDSAAKQEMETIYQFENDTLSPAALRAFEVRAAQMLQDVADYIQLLSDPSIEHSFKIQAKQMMLDVFTEPGNTVDFSASANEQSLKMEIGQFADSLLTGRLPVVKIELKNVQPSQNLQFTRHKIYEGQLTFQQTTYRIYKPGNIRLNGYRMKADITLKRVTKEFGSTTKDVWKVFLGNIERTD